MERASRILGKLSFPADSVDMEELVRAAWPATVGKRISAHARAIRIVRSTLIVEVDDPIWQRQLFVMTQQMVDRLEKTLGRRVVEDIELRVGVRRMGPQKAMRAAAQAPMFDQRDEAGEISDPMMRKIYRAARKKALA